MTLLRDIADAFRPPPPVKHAEWIPERVYVPRQGQAPLRFDLDTYPHAAGVLECYDDPNVREIYMGWSAQGLGKTTTALALAVSCAANMPRPMVAARENQENTETKLFAEQLVPMLEACTETRKLLPPEHRRRKESLDLTHCRIRRAFSGSPGTLSGYPAAIAICSEVSKWSRNETGEANPVELILARLTNYPFDSKAVFESTPATHGTCRVTGLIRKSGVLVLKRFVPCPHCGTYQALQFGKKEPDAPGLKWDKPKSGRSDPQLAEDTAYYQCAGRGCKIENQDRREMLQHGVWLAGNQKIGKAKTKAARILKAGKITGKRPEATKIAFGDPVDAPFGALYSLAISGWGWVARQFFDSSWQHFQNSILGAAFDPTPPETTPSELAERLKSDIPRGTIPEDARFLTFACDIGLANQDLIYYWMLTAWRNDGTGHIVDWGAAIGEREMWAAYASCQPSAVSHQLPVISGFDSGGGKNDAGDAVTERIYALCRGRRGVWPMKGSSVALGGTDWYTLGFQRAGASTRELNRKKKAGLGDLLLMSTPVTQSFRESLIAGRIKPGEVGHVTLPFEVSAHPELYEDLLDEFTCDVWIEGRWEKRSGRPNEYGDTLRMSRCLAELYTRGGKLWGRLPDPVAAPPVHSPADRPQRFATPDGRPFSVLER